MDRIRFKVNGVDCSVGVGVSSDMTLLDYLRDCAELRGTKYMCREGGCGACVVTTVKRAGFPPMAVNSCLVSVTSCQDWDITTIEKVGNKLDGYHPLQTALAEHNGTQCGYCTPGWIMSMYSLLQCKKDLTMLEIEQSFGSNVCRCTGYRPILEAFKKFAKDAPVPVQLTDIEDISICNKTGKSCNKNNECEEDDWCFVSHDDAKLTNITAICLNDGKKWFRANHIIDIFHILFTEGDDSYMLVCGNTAKGAYPIDEYPRILIDISEVIELKGYLVDQNLVIGANATLSEALDIFQNMAKYEYFGYLQKFYDHLKLVAHIPVRNLGSIAGNLMIKHQHNDFPSDIFLLLETIGARVTIMNHLGIRQSVTMQQFLNINMRRKIIFNVLLPPLNTEYNIVTFKIMPRAQNAHAIVNAGFLYKINKSTKRVTESRIVFGNLCPTFVRATKTERILIGKDLFTNETLQSAITSLKSELVVVENPPEPSAAYRKQLAINLFYKGLLTLCPTKALQPRFRSGVTRLRESRPVSDSRQIFDTNPTLWPLNKPVQKLEALIQCSGEAKYTEDIPSLPREVFAAFVLSSVPSGKLVSMDPSPALKLPGVLQFYSAKDIPGLNSYTPAGALLYLSNEELLCDGEVKYFYQPIGIIVAETRPLAERAAKLVKATYSNTKTPVVTDIKDAKKDPARNVIFSATIATDRGNNVDKVIKGSNTIYGQYHFTMENIVCVTKPIEEGLEVHASTQWMDGVQVMISRALNIDQNRIDVYVRRLGGGYGIKISRATQVAVACSLVTSKLNRPCRFIQPLTTTMRAVGKRLPCSTDFEVGVNSKGVIQYMNCDLYDDNGYITNETFGVLGFELINNCYDKSRWNYKWINSITDMASNTWCRSPATLEAIATTEVIMERISYELSLDPIDVRLANLDNIDSNDLRDMVETLKTNSDYSQRRADVDKFNGMNRWKKRGLRFSLLRWKPGGSQYLDVNLSVYHGDGTVIITHGGIEMGQGINTKAAQICAYLLKIPLEKIQIKGNNTIIAPNGYISGGSLTSQNIGVGVQRCCEQLLNILDPIRNQMNNPTWEELITNAFSKSIDLQTHGFVSPLDLQTYNIFGVTLAEVEVDVLTGEFGVRRVDLVQDVGRSVNPEVDIGQIEGAFIMGLGYWTCEDLVYYKDTGEILTDRTWNYHVPQARDIPQDFRVYLKKNSYSNDAMFGAKASGEPPICMSVVIPFAIREAIAAARLESGIATSEWFQIDGPYTSEAICMSTATKTEDFKYL